jgi:hypothetical protein
VQFRKLLAEGLDPNARYPDSDGTILQYAMTVRHQPEICESLIDAGADVHQPGLVAGACRIDFAGVLEKLIAAGADTNDLRDGQSPLPWYCIDNQPDIAKQLERMLEIGFDINGTSTVWPDNKTEVRNCTALMTAAWRGKPVLIRLLLARGADITHRDSLGRTALDWARTGKSKNHVKAIELLEEAGAAAGSEAEFGIAEIPDFRKAAKSPAHKQALAELQELTGAKPQKIELEDDTVVGGKAFVVEEDLAHRIVADHQAVFRSRGTLIFVSQDVTDRGGTCVVALPTADHLEAVAAIQTNGINSDVTTYDVIEWLRQLHAEQPFELTEISTDSIRGHFKSAIKDPQNLFRSMIDLCPDGVTGEKPNQDWLAQWAERRELFLWWD